MCLAFCPMKSHATTNARALQSTIIALSISLLVCILFVLCRLIWLVMSNEIARYNKSRCYTIGQLDDHRFCISYIYMGLSYLSYDEQFGKRHFDWQTQRSIRNDMYGAVIRRVGLVLMRSFSPTNLIESLQCQFS